MFDDFVSADTTPLFREETGDAKVCHLLWGDGIRVLRSGSPRTRVRARGREGWVRSDALGGDSLLEFYFIDVGQGDGVLVKSPDFRHVMIDGGFPRSFQATGKNAADFVDWKFAQDYGKRSVEIDALVCSHCDADHYGGLLDLLDANQLDELDANGVRVERFHHPGLGWWRGPGRGRVLGRWVESRGSTFWTQLLGDRASVASAVVAGSGPVAHGLWSDFLRAVLATKRRSGQPTGIQRLSHVDDYVPGFEPDVCSGPYIRVLGPVEFDVAGRPGLRRLPGGSSRNTRGASLLLRFDYGRTRVLLAGDLDRASQAALLEDYAGARQELACDLAKVCHHRSDDVSYAFLQAMQPAATVVSSGDDGDHHRPRAALLVASDASGLPRVEDELLTPLAFSTDLARSVDPGLPAPLEDLSAEGDAIDPLRSARLRRTVLQRDGTRWKSVRAGGPVYGLVNVRTDGERILCATLDERDQTWRIQTFKSRF